MAIDRQSLADSIFFGQAVATYGPIASNFKWYESGVEQFNQFDPEKAKSLLDERRLDRGLRRHPREGWAEALLHVISNDHYQPTTAAIDQAIVPMLADVGVEMKLNVPDAAEYFGIVAAAGGPREGGHGRRLDVRVAVVVAGRPADLLPGVPEHGLQRRPARHRSGGEAVADRAGRSRRSRRPRARSSSPGPSSCPRSRS